MPPIATTDPSTEETLETFTPHNREDVDRALTAARAAHETLRSMAIADRAMLLTKAAGVLDRRTEDIARLITTEMGKPISGSRAEVSKCVLGMRFYAEHAPAFLADERPTDPTSVGASDAYVTYQPLGTVLAVMPWNYPGWQVMRFAAPALMAGNSCVLKHASNVPQTALALQDVFDEAGYPPGAFTTLLVGSAEVESLVSDSRISAVTLTGSEGAGVSVAQSAGRALKKTVLELGGTDPFIVLPSADLDTAARVAATSRTQNSGQSCICAKRFIVHQHVYEPFAEAFVTAMEAIRVGEPSDPSTQMGPLATAAALQDIEELVADATSRGARLLTGGHRIERRGYYYAPTVIDGLDAAMRLWSEEAFAPVAGLYRAESFEHAIALANDCDLGLSSSVWTNDLGEQSRAVEQIEAGAVFINGMSASYPALPFGGIKRSGYGRELAANGIREFCNVKTVWKA